MKTHGETRNCSKDENFPQPQKLHRSHSVKHCTTLNSLLDKKPKLLFNSRNSQLTQDYQDSGGERISSSGGAV